MPKKADFSARAALRGVDDLSMPWDKALRRAERKAGRSFGRIERMGLRMGRGLRKAMRTSVDPIGAAGKGVRATGRAIGGLTKAIGAGAAVGALALDSYGKYELAVARLGNLLDDDVDAVDAYGDALKRTAVRFGIDPIETATGAYMAFSGGVETTTAALDEFLPVAAKASKAGKTELATAVDALTSIRNVYGDLSTAEISDRLFVTEALGKTDFGKIASSIGDIVAQGDAAGLSLDEMLAPMASITKTGVESGKAFNQLSSLISGLQEPTPKAVKALKKLGIAAGPDFVKDAGGMLGVVSQIRAAVDKFGAGSVLTKAVFGRKEAVKAATRLATSGFEDLEGTLVALGQSAGTTDAKFENFQRRTGFRIEQLKVGAKALFGELGGGLAEGLGIDELTDVPGAVDRASKSMRSGAKNFAEGFVKALVPAGKFADLDFDEMAREGGKAIGTLVSALGKFTVWASKAIVSLTAATKAVLDFADAAFKLDEAPDPVEAAAKAKGLGATRVKEGSEGGKRTLDDLAKLGKVREVSPAELAAERERRKARKPHYAKGGFMPPPVLSTAFSGRLEGLTDKLSAQAVAANAFAEVGGEVKVTVDVKGAADTKVEATSKSPKVPVRASVGKRAAAGGM